MATRTAKGLSEVIKELSVDYGARLADGPESPRPTRGAMLWFNEVKDAGVILTEDGERLPVTGPGFAGGVRPKGRCAQAVISCEVMETRGVRKATEVVFVSEQSPRRARLRHRSAGR